VNRQARAILQAGDWSQLERRTGGCAGRTASARRGMPASKHLSGGEKRRVRAYAACCCSASRQCCCSMATHQPLGTHFRRWLEHFPADLPGTVVAITHDRYSLITSAGWDFWNWTVPTDPLQRGNYSQWLESNQTVWLKKAGRSPSHSSDESRTGMVRQAPKVRQSKSKARLHVLKNGNPRSSRSAAKPTHILIPGALAWATRSSRF